MHRYCFYIDGFNVYHALTEKQKTGPEIGDWLSEEFVSVFWEPYISAIEPVVFGNFVVNTLRDVEAITRRIEEYNFVKSTGTYVCYSDSKYTRQGRVWLEQLVSGTTPE